MPKSRDELWRHCFQYWVPTSKRNRQQRSLTLGSNASTRRQSTVSMRRDSCIGAWLLLSEEVPETAPKRDRSANHSQCEVGPMGARDHRLRLHMMCLQRASSKTKEFARKHLADKHKGRLMQCRLGMIRRFLERANAFTT